MSEGIKIDDGFQDEMNIQEFPAENLILQKTLSGGALFQQMLEEQARQEAEQEQRRMEAERIAHE